MERLLTAALVDVDALDPAHRDARYCLNEYFAELDRRFPGGFDPALSLSADLDELRPPAGLFLVATLRAEPIGCGALKFHGAEPTELKRMWVANSARGLGVGRRMLAELESRSAAHDSRTVRLETNETLVEAIALYRSAGYTEVDAFNDEPTRTTGSRSTCRDEFRSVSRSNNRRCDERSARLRRGRMAGT